MVTSGFANIFRIPELRKRILFTLGMLAVYRIGIFVTTPGVDRVAMKRVVVQAVGRPARPLQPVLRRRARAAVDLRARASCRTSRRASSCSCSRWWSRSLESLQKEGEAGRRKINQYTRYGTIVLSIVQGFGIAMLPRGARPRHERRRRRRRRRPGLGLPAHDDHHAHHRHGFIMWLGEQITERGIGNGISLIIFAGIVAGIPDAMLPHLRGGAGRRIAARRARWSLVGRHARRDRARSSSSSAASAASRSSTRSAWSGGACTAARRRTCR